jgi:hypothetical protein
MQWTHSAQHVRDEHRLSVHAHAVASICGFELQCNELQSPLPRAQHARYIRPLGQSRSLQHARDVHPVVGRAHVVDRCKTRVRLGERDASGELAPLVLAGDTPHQDVNRLVDRCALLLSSVVSVLARSRSPDARSPGTATSGSSRQRCNSGASASTAATTASSMSLQCPAVTMMASQLDAGT